MRRALGIGFVVTVLPLAVAEAQNRIVNPEFDTDTSGWTQALSWSPFDRDGCSRSGSGQSAGSFFHQWQCVPVHAGEPLVVEYSFKTFPNPDDWFEGSGVSCFATSDCSGTAAVLAPLAEALGVRKGWNRHRLEYSIPGGVASCLVDLVAVADASASWLDGVHAGPPDLFAEDFEQGSGCRWDRGPAEEMTILLPGDVPLTLVLIPAGTFQMGSPESERGRQADETLHDVLLTQPYWMGKTEVTQAQWEALMGPWAYTCGGPTSGVGPDYPAYCVSWDDVGGPGGFLDLLNTHLGTTLFRLPTEAEWERAARGGTQTRFSHGDVLECGDFCEACAVHDQYMSWCGHHNGVGAWSVGSKGANPFGLHDMHGNLRELVQDWYDPNPSGAATDPTGPASGSYRVVRGGYWYASAASCRSALRQVILPTHRFYNVGFRLARSQ